RLTPYFIEGIADSSGAVVFEATPPLACPGCVNLPTGDAASAAGASGMATGDAVASNFPDGDSTAGNPGSEVPLERRAPRAISAANAFVMTDMMTDVIQRGTGQRAKALGRRDVAGKTGTTSDHRDAWFVGFNADLVAAAWIGFDQERSLGNNEEGGRTALPMWLYFMQVALQDRPEHRLPEPPGIMRIWVSRESGAPASAGSPGAIFEVFLDRFPPQAGLSGSGAEVDAESVRSPASEESIF
ncbi:MAG: hypothetical protein MUO39_12395, partial [Steroidobacteraceae bacterium]|nr:hypothetical protein [Steroidobacteraceae bacterium]